MKNKRNIIEIKIDEELIKDCCKFTGLSREEIIENIDILKELGLIKVEE